MSTAQLNNTNKIAESRRIMNMKNLGEAEATALYGFYEEFNPIFEDPEQFQSFSQQKKRLLLSQYCNSCSRYTRQIWL